MRFTQTSLLAFLALVLFSTCNDPALEKKFLNARVYDKQLMTAELNHLNTIDISNLTDLEQGAVTARRAEIKMIEDAIAASTNIFAIGARCDRVPPGPCPKIGEIVNDLPIGTEIELDLLGSYSDVIEAANPQSRVLADQGSAALVTPDGKKLFAQGTFYAYDSLLHTTWYAFDVKQKSLGAGPLVLKITTQLIVNQQVTSVIIEKPIPAGTFLGSNIR
jgi:hypothetical protein